MTPFPLRRGSAGRPGRYERLASTLKRMHLAAFAIVILGLVNWAGSAYHALAKAVDAR